MGRVTRRDAVALLGSLMGAGGWPAGAAAGTAHWPSGPVRIVSPLAPGGPNDVSARLIAERLADRLGVPFLVENRSGAATRIGTESVVHARNDGATLLYAAAALAVLPSLYPLGYDWRRDLVPVTLAVDAPVFLVVDAALPARNLGEFLAHARAKPGGLTFAAPGVGSVPHLVTELLLRKLAAPGLIVQFRGDAAAYVELLAGRADAILSVPTAAMPYLGSNRLRMLAVAADERSPLFPDVPTFAEQDMAGIAGSAWFGFLAPARTPGEVIAVVSDGVRSVLDEPATREKLRALGLQPVGSTPAEFAAFIDREARRWSEVVRRARIKGE